jgi:hypothetical protein
MWRPNKKKATRRFRRTASSDYGRVVAPKFEPTVLEFIEACVGALPYLADAKRVVAQPA